MTRREKQEATIVMKILETDIKDLFVDIWYKYQIFNFTVSSGIISNKNIEDMVEIHCMGKVFHILILKVSELKNGVRIRSLVKKEIV